MIPYYQDDYITIYNGDCEALLPGIRGIDSLITDPPYGIDFDTDYTRFSGGAIESNRYQQIANDTYSFDPSHLLRFRRVVLFGANTLSRWLDIGSFLIWDKRMPQAKENFLSDAEVAWMNHGHGTYIFQHTWNGFIRASEKGTAYHPTQKPVAVMRWIIGKAKPQGLICDPYAGSGSTLVAAKQLGFKAIGIEIHEPYCEIAARRVEQTGVMFSLEMSNGTPAAEQLALLPEAD